MGTGVSAKFVRSLRTRAREIDWDAWRWRNLDKRKLRFPFRVILHPVSGFTELKYEGRGSVGLAIVIWMLLFVMSVVSYFENGFVFNTNRPQEFNVFLQFFTSSLLLLLWCIANWALCTLFDGEGRFGEIWTAACYAFFPKVLFGIPMVMLSRVLCLEEQAFLVIFQGVLTGWCILLLFIGTLVVHQFSFKKTLLSCLLTVGGIVAILYLAMLFVSMFQQMLAFVQTIIKEALSRR